MKGNEQNQITLMVLELASFLPEEMQDSFIEKKKKYKDYSKIDWTTYYENDEC